MAVAIQNDGNPDRDGYLPSERVQQNNIYKMKL